MNAHDELLRLAADALRECVEWMEVAEVRREDDAPPITQAKAAIAALAAPKEAGDGFAQVCDALGIGGEARSVSCALTNIRNLRRFAENLHAIEREFFMVPGEPDDDFPGDEPMPECLLNSWGSTTEQYVEQFRAAIPRLAAKPSDQQGREWQPIETAPLDGTWVLTFAPRRTDFTKHITTNRFKDGAWQHCNSACPPSHWQPLPEQPQ